MTRDDVIRLMIEAEPGMLINIKDHEEGMEGFTGEDPKLMQFWPFKTYVKFAALVAAHERETCLALVNQGTGEATSADALKILRMERDRISAAIRARGEQEQPR